MVTLTPILGRMLAISTGMVSDEIIDGAVHLNSFKLRTIETGTKNYK